MSFIAAMTSIAARSRRSVSLPSLGSRVPNRCGDERGVSAKVVREEGLALRTGDRALTIDAGDTDWNAKARPPGKRGRAFALLSRSDNLDPGAPRHGRQTRLGVSDA